MKKINISYNNNKEMWVSDRTEKDIITIDNVINIVNEEHNDKIRKDINYELKKIVEVVQQIEQYFLNTEDTEWTNKKRMLEAQLISNNSNNIHVQISHNKSKLFDLFIIKTNQDEVKYCLYVDGDTILEIADNKMFFLTKKGEILNKIMPDITSLYWSLPPAAYRMKVKKWEDLNTEEKFFMLNAIKPNWFNILVINKIVAMTKNTIKVVDNIQDKYFMCNGEYVKFDYRINIESKNSQKTIFNIYNIKNINSKYNIVLEFNSEEKYYKILVSENNEVKMSCRLNFVIKQKKVRDWDNFVIKTVEEQHFDSLEVEILDTCLPSRVNSILWMFV